jgi:hypothetical protein
MVALLAQEKYFEGLTQRFRTEDKNTSKKLPLRSNHARRAKIPRWYIPQEVGDPKNGFSSWSKETDLARSDVSDDASFL